MKKLLSLVLAVVMVLGLSVTAFAAENDKSGATTITATKEAAELAYTIVIPTATELTEEAHKDVQLGGAEGKASITVTTGSDKTNVYYTVDLTNATLTDGTNTITTSYAYAQGGDYAELTNGTKVTVYKGGTVKDSTVQVTADDTAWADAPAGEYTASVVFNFATEEAEAATVTAADVFVTGAKYKLNFKLVQNLSYTFEKTTDGYEVVEILQDGNDVTDSVKQSCSLTADGTEIVFRSGAGSLEIKVDTSTNTYSLDGQYYNLVGSLSFSVSPAGATEFTEITLTAAG